MLKSLLKWLVAAISGLLMVVLILALFTWLAIPVKSMLSGYFTDYFSTGVDDLPRVSLPGETPPWADEDWVRPPAEPPMCQFNISGRITRDDGAPIRNAEVKIYNSGMFDSGDYRFTDDNGEFSYTELGTETCDKEQFYLSISKNGFEPHYAIAAPDDQLIITLNYLPIY